jgi:hypothetical protein
VNPASGTNTQGIERSWLDAKIKILRNIRVPATSATCNTVDHILTGRSHIGRAPAFLNP